MGWDNAEEIGGDGELEKVDEEEKEEEEEKKGKEYGNPYGGGGGGRRRKRRRKKKRIEIRLIVCVIASGCLCEFVWLFV